MDGGKERAGTGPGPSVPDWQDTLATWNSSSDWCLWTHLSCQSKLQRLCPWGKAVLLIGGTFNKRFKRILEGILFQKILVLYSFWWKQNKTKAYLSTLEKLFIVYPLPIGEVTFPQERCLFLWCFICTESSPSSLIPVTNLLLFWDSVRASHLVTPGLPWVTLHNGAALHLHYCPCRLLGKVLAFQPSRWSFCRKKSRPL